MSRLGIDLDTGLVYEGREGPSHPVWPTPVIAQTTLISSPSDLAKIPANFASNPLTWIFLEASYDPVSRIRRGRIFQNFGMQSRETVQVEAHPAVNSDLLKATNNGGRVGKNLTVYIACAELLSQPNKGEGLQLAIGQRDASSLWRILQTERLIGTDILVTLRAESALGILPEIDKGKIHPNSVAAVASAYLRVLNAAYRELPSSVVDQCRNAAVVLVSRWMQTETDSLAPKEQDLGDWIKAIKNHFGENRRVALRSTLEIINRLHPRGKDNELIKLGLRPITEQDAEFAVQALGFVVREIGWAAF